MAIVNWYFRYSDIDWKKVARIKELLIKFIKEWKK